tara:strand:- start:1933 stop:2226 length:294 start_codon:yes stop_codon:yes gene_type:complete
MRVIFSAASRKDLLAIAVFIAADNPARARSFVNELRVACAGLAEQADRFAVIPGYEAKGYRRRPHGHYSIIYFADQDTVRIFRVVHSARNLGQVLGD